MPSTLSNPTVTHDLTADLRTSVFSGSVQHRPTMAGTLSVGTAAGSVNLLYSADVTIATGVPLVLDLTNLTDPAGSAIAFGHLTHWMIENRSTVAGQNFTIGGGTDGVFAAMPVTVNANGGVSSHADPNPGIVVDGTHKNLQIAVAAGTAVGGRVTLLGRTT